ncbi:MAG: hypothetical protein K2X67_00220 [Burkholderiales bacterium]|nr:hypothetical protein [Burkholderiales bacterium]
MNNNIGWVLLGSIAVAGCATVPDPGAQEWTARQSGSRIEQAAGRSAVQDGVQAARYRALASDDAWLAEYAAYAASIRESVAAGDLTEAEGNRLIARQRRVSEAERLVAVRHESRYSYPDN